MTRVANSVQYTTKYLYRYRYRGIVIVTTNTVVYLIQFQLTGLRGWVMNTEAGTVTGEAHGEKSSMENLYAFRCSLGCGLAMEMYCCITSVCHLLYASKHWLTNTCSPKSRIDKAEFHNEQEQLEPFTEFKSFTVRKQHGFLIKFFLLVSFYFMCSSICDSLDKRRRKSISRKFLHLSCLTKTQDTSGKEHCEFWILDYHFFFFLLNYVCNSSGTKIGPAQTH